LRASGKDSVTEAYFDTLFDEMEDIAKTREEKLLEQKEVCFMRDIKKKVILKKIRW